MPHRKYTLSAPILEQASTWFVDFNEGDVSDTQRSDFFHWLCRSPEHIQAYLEIAAVYEEAPALNKTRLYDAQALIAWAQQETNIVPIDAAGSIERSLPAAETGSTIAAHAPGPSRNRKLSARSWPIAAAVLLAGMGLATWLTWQRDTYTTQIGEQRLITLADGSTMELNARSRVRVHFSEHERDVDLLDGQALFHVAKDTERPFIVASDGTRVRAVGTLFDVYQRKAGTVVTVVEGRVAVSSVSRVQPPAAPESTTPLEGGAGRGPVLPTSSDGILLSAGEQVTVSAHAARSKPSHTNVAAATAWTRRQLVFNSAPLSEVVEEYNRYNAHPLVLHDPQLEDLHISGVFSATDPESLLAFLRAQPHMKLVAHDGAHELVRTRE